MSLKEYFQLAETKVSSARKVDAADATKDAASGQCQLEVSTMDASWQHLLEPEFKKSYFIKVLLPSRVFPWWPFRAHEMVMIVEAIPRV